MVAAEGGSDGASHCTETVPHIDNNHDRVDHMAPGQIIRTPFSISHNDTISETESIISDRHGHHLHKNLRHHSDKYEKYNKYNGRCKQNKEFI